MNNRPAYEKNHPKLYEWRETKALIVLGRFIDHVNNSILYDLVLYTWVP